MVFGFPGGLSETDWFNGPTGVLGTAVTGLAYNQACYTANVHMRQNQHYQEKNYHLSWVGVARSDIREMMNITVTRIQNYTLVATLIVGGVAWNVFIGPTSGTGYQFGQDFPGREFVLSAFWVSMGISIVFFMIAIMFAIKGQNSAFLNTMRLLTWECRPENPSQYNHDYMTQTQQFEKDGVRSIFRLPGTTPNYNHHSDAKDGLANEVRKECRSKTMMASRAALRTQRDVEQGAPGSTTPSRSPDERAPERSNKRHVTFSEDVEENSANTSCETRPETKPQQKGPLEQVMPRTRELSHLARFANFMQLWQPFDSQSKNCIGFGLVSLAQGTMYWLHAILCGQGRPLAALMVMGIFAYVVVMVLQNSTKKFKSVFSVFPVMLLFISAPALGWVATAARFWHSYTFLPNFVEPAWLSVVFAPLCGVLECLMYILMYVQSFKEFKMPHEITQKYITGPNGQRFTEYSNEPVRKAGEDPEQSLIDMATSPEEEARATEVRRSVRKAVRVLLVASAIIWFFFVLGFLPDVVRFYRSEPLATGLDEVPVTWPSNTIYPTALAVAGNKAFAANKYQVFEFPLNGGEASQVQCKLTATIADVIAQCDDAGDCWPLVLLGGSSPKIVDCRTGQETPLLHEAAKSAFPRHVARRPDSDDSMVAVLGTGAVVKYGSAQADQWSPLRKMAQLDSDAVQGEGFDFDYWADRLFLVERHTSGQYASSRMRVLNLQSLEPVGEWIVPRQYGQLSAGSAITRDTLLLLTQGAKPKLFRWTVPQHA
jgi:hypothetical protein